MRARIVPRQTARASALEFQIRQGVHKPVVPIRVRTRCGGRTVDIVRRVVSYDRGATPQVFYDYRWYPLQDACLDEVGLEEIWLDHPCPNRREVAYGQR